MCSDLSQCIAILLNRLLYRSTSFADIHLHLSTKDLLQGRTVCVTLTPGYLGDIFVLSKMIHELINKTLLTQECLSPYLRPDRGLSDAPRYELPVFPLGLSSLSTELAEYPVRGKTRMGLCATRRGQVTRPRILLRLRCHLGSNGIQNNIPAYFQEMTVLLDQDRLIAALEQVTGPAVALIEELGVNTV